MTPEIVERSVSLAAFGSSIAPAGAAVVGIAESTVIAETADVSTADESTLGADSVLHAAITRTNGTAAIDDHFIAFSVELLLS